MMNSLFLDSWMIWKTIFQVSRSEFSTAIDTLANEILRETGQTPSLKIEFFKASQKLHEDMALDQPQLLGTSPTLKNAPANLWRNSNLIFATFNTAATNDKPAVAATISLGGFNRRFERTRREMHFKVNPPEIGRKIGDRFLNENANFMFWNRGIGI